MGSPEHGREPCPDRILDDCGNAFSMGAVGGSLFHFLKGVYHSPKGERLIGGTQTARMNAPRTAGGFAVWGGLFSVFDCSFVYLRQKEDPWNSILAGATTGGFLQMRRGLAASGRSALFGGALLALMEGAAIAMTRLSAPVADMPIVIDDPMANMAGGSGISMASGSSSDSGSSSWFGGWFGGGEKKQDSAASGGIKTEVLESFDAPFPPTFEFK